MADLAPLHILIVVDGGDEKGALTLAQEAETVRRMASTSNPAFKLPIWSYEIVRASLDEASRVIKNWDAIVHLKYRIDGFQTDAFQMAGFESLSAKKKLLIGTDSGIGDAIDLKAFDNYFLPVEGAEIDHVFWHDAAEFIYNCVVNPDNIVPDEGVKERLDEEGIPADLADMFTISDTKPSLALQKLLLSATENFGEKRKEDGTVIVSVSSLFQAMFHEGLNEREADQISWMLEQYHKRWKNVGAPAE